MAAVYEATDNVLRTRVALKLIGSSIAQDSTAMERFRREVLLARKGASSSQRPLAGAKR